MLYNNLHDAFLVWLWWSLGYHTITYNNKYHLCCSILYIFYYIIWCIS